jgi:hypothetical protein
MPKFRGVARIRVDRAGEQQVHSIVEAFPNAEYDYPRREITHIAVVHAEDEVAARGQVLGRVSKVLSDAGLSGVDYSVESHVMRL